MTLSPSAFQERESESSLGLYRRLLGARWNEVHPNLHLVHLSDERVVGSGSIRVVRGESPLARFLLWLLRMPVATESGEILLEITPYEGSERWLRTFGSRWLLTSQREGRGGRLIERFDIFEFDFRLEVDSGGIRYCQEAFGLRFGRVYLRLPLWMSAQITAWEEAVRETDSFSVAVTISAPLAGFILSYQGDLELKEV